MKNAENNPIRAMHLQKMKQAKFLIMRKNMTYKDTAKAVGVNEKSISAWVKEFGWKQDHIQALYETKGANSLQDFMTFVNNEYPKQYAQAQEMYNNYISHF